MISNTIRTKLRAALVGATLLATLGGCQSQWFLDDERSDLITTRVHVNSVPAGAEIQLDNRGFGRAPLILPIEYDHLDQIWRRQTNAGAAMREDWGPAGTVVGAPLWVPASAVHHEEALRKHSYSHNEFTLTATMPGYRKVTQQLVLQGEDIVEITLELEPVE